MKLIESIGSHSFERIVQFRACPGVDLLAAIEAAATDQKIGAGIVLSGIGALQQAVFRNLKRFPAQFPVRDEDRLFETLQTPMELVALTGWLASRRDGTLDIHAHFAASMVVDDRIVTRGGHLTAGTLCGIKVVVAIGVIADHRVFSGLDVNTRAHDIFFD